jgi:two-component system, NtrC family, nitrogen regulation sensor histidine kinase NtrY
MKNFSINLIVRILLLIISALLTVWAIDKYSNDTMMAVIGLGLVGLQMYSLHQYIINVNRKLIRFFESVRYSDFAIKFKADDQRGDTFRDLNLQLNEVLEAFRTARAEKEANLQYLNTIVQQINTGLISFDSDGRVELVNNAALKMLHIYRIRQLDDLKDQHPQLVALCNKQNTGLRQLYQTPNDIPLSVQVTPIQLRGKDLRILVLQNIESELQEKEIEAWQNLTKVLRHEIMNSLTPVLSLVGTMKEIVMLDVLPLLPQNESIQDLSEALQTLEKRSVGIIQFVNAYRDFTTLPNPVFVELSVNTLINSVLQLFSQDFQRLHIRLQVNILPNNLTIQADPNLIEQVLINLFKNAIEALHHQAKPTLVVKAYLDQNQRRLIEISDNGQGIEPEALERIFIPFFTTKKTGSGIGLSLSRQIVQQHGGQLTVESKVDEGTSFFLNFGS